MSRTNKSKDAGYAVTIDLERAEVLYLAALIEKDKTSPLKLCAKFLRQIEDRRKKDRRQK